MNLCTTLTPGAVLARINAAHPAHRAYDGHHDDLLASGGVRRVNVEDERIKFSLDAFSKALLDSDSEESPKELLVQVAPPLYVQVHSTLVKPMFVQLSAIESLIESRVITLWLFSCEQRPPFLRLGLRKSAE